jgi:putative membrane protein insertion efficiency factor
MKSHEEASTQPATGLGVRMLQALIRAYRAVVAPWLGPRCRFYPSCSRYALDALEVHGALQGSWLTLRRLLRCQPLSEGGVDPVPPTVEPL